jgi:phosphoribosylamine-glycine ligase
LLAEIGYVGNCSVNTLIDERGKPWPLEFTMRLGWPAFNIETDLFDCDPIEFLHALALGERIPASARRLDEVGLGVVLATPPYPYPPKSYDDIVGIPVWFQGTDALAGFHPCEVAAGIETLYESAGHYIGVGVGRGENVRTASRQAYRVLEHIAMPCSPFWRNDIGDRLRKELPKLQAHGFATGMEY